MNLATHKSVLQFAWPMMLSNITVPLLGLVDAGVLGHLSDPRYLAAVSIGASLFGFIYWAFGFLRMGTTGLVAQAQGASDFQSIRDTLFQSLLIAFGIGILLIVISPFLLKVAVPFYAPSDEVITELYSYFQIRIFAAPAVMANYVIIGWLIGVQRPKLPMLLMIFTNIVNILLDLILVMGFGFKTAGVAIGTMAADYGCLALGIYLVAHHMKGLPGKFIFKNIIDLDSLQSIFSVNRHLFVRTLCLLFTLAFFTAQSSRQGDTILAANALLLNFLLIISNALDGFAHAAEALTGNALGKKRVDQFNEILKVTGLWSAGTAVILILTFTGIGGLVINMLTTIDSIRAAANEFLPWLIWLPAVTVWSYWLDGVFIGAIKTKLMQNIVLVSTFVFFLPSWLLFSHLGNTGLWLSLFIFMSARSLIMAFFTWRIQRHSAWIS